MALKFLNKKGWHTGSLRNLENVWKAEQKHEAEQKKLEELKVQIHKEREAEELRQQYQAAGLAPKQDRLEFLYDSGAGPSGSKPADDYYSQKASVEPKTDSKPAKPGEKVAAQTPGALFAPENNNISANDKWRKIHSDPLYLIKQQELAALERIRKNPVKMELLANQVRQKLKSGQDGDEDEDGKHRKKRKKEKKNRKRHRDHELEKKGFRNGKEKRSKSDKHRKRRDRDDSSDSESSDSEPEARPPKKVETDDRYGRIGERDYGHRENLDRETGAAKSNGFNDNRSKRYRDGSPSRLQEEDQRERGGKLTERSTRETDGGDRYRVNGGTSQRSEHYDRDDRPSRKYDIESRSSGEFEKRYRSSKEFHRGHRGGESPVLEDRHSTYLDGCDSRPRNYERDNRSCKEYGRNRSHEKDYDREDRHKTLRD